MPPLKWSGIWKPTFSCDKSLFIHERNRLALLGAKTAALAGSDLLQVASSGSEFLGQTLLINKLAAN